MDPAIIGATVGAVIALAGVLLQSLLGAKLMKGQSLRDKRTAVYSQLLAASIAEESYPFYNPRPFESDAVEKYNTKVERWRAGRRELKGLAARALLLARSSSLKGELRAFVQNNDPDKRLSGVEELMRKEISG